MKKYLFIAGIALAALWSCGNKGSEDKLTSAKQAEKAGVITMAEPELYITIPSGKMLGVTKIEFFPDGAFKGEGIESILKSVPDVIYFGGTFTTNNNVYSLNGDLLAEVVIDGNSASIKVNGKTVSGSFQSASVPSSTVEQALCMSWKPTQLEVAITQPDVKHKFSGSDACNLYVMAQYINNNQHEVQLDLERFENHVIKSISLSPAPEKSVMICFTDATIEPIVGSWSSVGSIDNQKFSYKLNAELEGKMFEAEADGSFEFSNSFNTIKITINISSDEMNGKVIITANRV